MTLPPGTTHVPFIDVASIRLSSGTIAKYAKNAPGSVWYIGGEPNRSDVTSAEYAIELNYYTTAIKAADSIVKIMSASILNWDFTCTQCGRFQSGESWLREFIDSYQATHSGNLPPNDIRAIDTYPARWDQVPMVDWFAVTRQMEGLREFLNTVLLRRNDPIWVSEIASPWAYSARTIAENGGITRNWIGKKIFSGTTRSIVSSK